MTLNSAATQILTQITTSTQSLASTLASSSISQNHTHFPSNLFVKPSIPMAYFQSLLKALGKHTETSPKTQSHYKTAR